MEKAYGEHGRVYFILPKTMNKVEVLKAVAVESHHTVDDFKVTFAKKTGKDTFDVELKSGDLWCVTRR